MTWPLTFCVEINLVGLTSIKCTQYISGSVSGGTHTFMCMMGCNLNFSVMHRTNVTILVCGQSIKVGRMCNLHTDFLEMFYELSIKMKVLTLLLGF